MRQKQCKRCGNIFDTDKTWIYYCRDCAAIVKREGAYAQHTCAVCGVSFVGGLAAKYCPTCRDEVVRIRDREYKKAGSRRPLGSTDNCQRCGDAYIVESGMQKYCKKCAEQAVKDKINATARQYAVDNYDRLKEHRRNMLHGAKVCVICGNPITIHTPTVACSDECDREQRRRHQAITDLKRGKRKTPLGSRDKDKLDKE